MQIDISQIEIAKTLNNKLEEIKKSNPSYSMRSFARKLDINSGALSQIMKGKRIISEEFALKLATNLNLTVDEKQIFLKCFEIKKLISQSSPVNPNDVLTFSIPITSENLSLAKDKIQKFQHEISTLLNKEEKKEIYKLTVGLYPIYKKH